MSTIVHAHLFGEVEVANSIADAPASQLPLILTATFAKADPKNGVAIIGGGGQAGRVYAVGETVAGGAVLAEVFVDNVLLSRNGAFEKLTMRMRDSLGEAPGGAGRSARQPNTQPEKVQAAPTTVSDVDANTPVSMKSFVLLPVFGDRQAGARIGAAKNPAVLARAGLKSGDIITAINGEPVHGMHAAAALLDAAAGGALTLTIMRGGNREDLQVESLD